VSQQWKLARMGAELFLVYRDKVRADETVAQIRNSTGNENVHLLRADLGSQKQIREAAVQFLATGRCYRGRFADACAVTSTRSASL
jgi:short-subunit dehydrogenase